jgi:hypothetical protein
MGSPRVDADVDGVDAIVARIVARAPSRARRRAGDVAPRRASYPETLEATHGTARGRSVCANSERLIYDAVGRYG